MGLPDTLYLFRGTMLLSALSRIVAGRKFNYSPKSKGHNPTLQEDSMIFRKQEEEVPLPLPFSCFS